MLRPSDDCHISFFLSFSSVLFLLSSSLKFQRPFKSRARVIALVIVPTISRCIRYIEQAANDTII